MKGKVVFMSKKRFISKMLVTAMVVTMAFPASGNIVKAEEKKDVITESDMAITSDGAGILKDMYLNGELTDAIEAMQADSEEPIVTLDAAPPVTAVGILEVRSTQINSEPIEENQYTTKYDHGGDEMYVLTYRLGYGQDYATYNGVAVKYIASRAIDVDNNGVVDGWYFLWNLSGMDSAGTFVYKSTSYNKPWNTMSTWIDIR